MIGYHVTWKSNLPSIFEKGLQPGADTEPSGVYLFTGLYPEVLTDVMEHICDYFLAEMELELTPETEDPWISENFAVLQVNCPDTLEFIWANVAISPEVIEPSAISEISNWVDVWHKHVHPTKGN